MFRVIGNYETIGTPTVAGILPPNAPYSGDAPIIVARPLLITCHVVGMLNSLYKLVQVGAASRPVHGAKLSSALDCFIIFAGVLKLTHSRLIGSLIWSCACVLKNALSRNLIEVREVFADVT